MLFLVHENSFKLNIHWQHISSLTPFHFQNLSIQLGFTYIIYILCLLSSYSLKFFTSYHSPLTSHTILTNLSLKYSSSCSNMMKTCLFKFVVVICPATKIAPKLSTHTVMGSLTGMFMLLNNWIKTLLLFQSQKVITILLLSLIISCFLMP